MIDQQWSALFLRAFLCLYDCVKVKLQLQYCTVILQTNVWRVSFFVLQEFLIYLTSRLFLLLCSPRLIFFSAFLYSAQDLSHKIGLWTLKSWTLLIRVSISLTVEVHGVSAVGGGAVIWVQPILFVSVTVSFLSLKVLKLYNQCPERSGISTICSKSVFRKAIEKYSKNVSNFSSCYSKLCFIFVFVLFWWRTNTRETRSLIVFFQ